jgi:hypothetical protein
MHTKKRLEACTNRQLWCIVILMNTCILLSFLGLIFFPGIIILVAVSRPSDTETKGAVLVITNLCFFLGGGILHMFCGLLVGLPIEQPFSRKNVDRILTTLERRRMARLPKEPCTCCGYDLQQSPMYCPECGANRC